MFEEFLIHNQFKESVTRYRNFDPHLKKIKNLSFKYQSSLIDAPEFHIPGIYLITGGRQVGKTTFIKQLILKLLTKGKCKPDNILFLTGELIDSHHILRRMIEKFYDQKAFQYLFVDEVSYIPEWDKSIKYLADSGIFEHMSVILTGSDNQIIRTAMKRFAGRRGKADKVDFIFLPISFKESVILKNPKLNSLCKKIADAPVTRPLAEYCDHHEVLMRYFLEYLLHGGYLPAISDYLTTKIISKAVFNTYVEWIIGDVLKHNKSEHYLYEILKGIKATYSSQISWNNLAKHLSIDHHKTVADYCMLLQSINVIYILEALSEHKLSAAPKKNKKLYFRDPFIYHSVLSHIEQNYSFVSMKERMNKPQYASQFVEMTVVDHCKRWNSTFYIKGKKGEVDVAILQNKTFCPIEIKWTKQLRKEELKQIKQYKNGIILTPQAEHKRLGQNKIIPIVHFMIHVSGGQFCF
ncbi:MAG: ATP-binding protein [Candidatus Omnitrophica bacterium]|nr:ATP-binding protein [Candidatus Omnitrophota bacterium]